MQRTERGLGKEINDEVAERKKEKEEKQAKEKTQDEKNTMIIQ